MARREDGLLLAALLVLASSIAPAHACPSACAATRLGPFVASHRRLPFVPAEAPAAAAPRKFPFPPVPVEIEHGPRYPNHARELDRRLLLREIANVARLLRVTPRDSADRPRVMRRLADNYAELAASARDDLRRDRKRAAEASRLTRRASDKAIALYTALAREHPRYCVSPARILRIDRGCNDEALHYLASELAQTGRADEALDAHRAILRGWPRSPYGAHAQLALAERLFEQARRDPARWPAARRAYEATLTRAPGGSSLEGYARYKLAHVFWSEGDVKRALAHLETVIARAMQPGAPTELARLTDAARRDMVLSYAQVGTPERAYAAFSGLSGDPAGKSERTLAMVEQLARHLLDIGRHSQAIAVYRDLLERRPRCSHRVAIARATLARDPTNHAAVLEALDELRKMHLALASSRPRETETERCRDAAAQLVWDTAASWHAEALGSGDARGTGNRETLAGVSRLYGWLDDDFDKRTVVAREVLSYRHGDVLHELGSWRECGHAFARAYELEPDGELAADALSAAAGCWMRAKSSATDEVVRRVYEKALCRLEAPSDDPRARALYRAIARASAPACTTP